MTVYRTALRGQPRARRDDMQAKTGIAPTTIDPPDSPGGSLTPAVAELIDTMSVNSSAFQAGWDAGFQDALLPDEHPEQNRCAVAYAAWLTSLAKSPGKDQ